jgi:hypothetical protein
VIPSLSVKLLSSLSILKELFPDLDYPFLGGAFLFEDPET